MNFFAGLLLGFIVGCIITFFYFRSRWISIKETIIKEPTKEVEQILFEQTMPNKKGEFVVVNHAEVIMRDSEGDISLDKVIQDE